MIAKLSTCTYRRRQQESKQITMQKEDYGKKIMINMIIIRPIYNFTEVSRLWKLISAS